MELRLLLSWLPNREISLYCPGEFNIITRVLKHEEGGQKVRTREMASGQRLDQPSLTLEVNRRPWKCEQVWKGLSLEPPEEHRPADTLTLAQ